MSVQFVVEPRRKQASLEAEAFHRWELPIGTDWMLFYRIGKNYLLRFPEYADFEVAADGADVRAFPTFEATEATIEHLYLNQALPLALSRQGALMFHASAVVLANGDSVAFMAASGVGKSTLAASFAAVGFSFLTDDGLRIEHREDRYLVHPSHPSLRLWSDSLESLFNDDAQLAPPVSYTSKTRILSNERIRYCGSPRPLQRIYFLGPGTTAEPVFESLAPAEALVALTSHSFLLDVESRDHVAKHFDWLAEFVMQPIFYRLDYPRKFEALADVQAAIISHATRKHGERLGNTY